MAKVAKEKREHRRINAFDVMIILLALCLLGALGYRIYQGVSTPDVVKNSRYIVEFECDGIYNSLAEYVDNDDVVYFAKSGEVLGHIYMTREDSHPLEIITEGVEPTPDEETETETEEEGVSYEKVNARGKLKLNADAIETEENYFTVGELGFTTGSVIEVYTSKATFIIRITGIQSID